MKKVIFIFLICFLLVPFAGEAKVYLHTSKKTIIKDNKVKVYGYVKPREKGVKVKIFRKYQKKYKYIKTKKINKKGKFSFYTRPSQTAFFRAKTKDQDKWEWGNKKKRVKVRLYPKCGDDYTWYSNSILDNDDYIAITPLGAMNPTGHVFPTDHMYYYLTEGMTKVPIYAPGDIWLETISTSEHLSADPVFTDYDIEFRSCAKFHGFMGHISGISEAMQDAWNKGVQDYECFSYEAGGEEYERCSRTVRKKLMAGDEIGTAGGNTGQGALDWGTYDTRVAVTGVANESRWYDSRLYNVCPLDYYPADLKDYFYSLLGNGTVSRVGEPLCGTIKQDVAGTAQGRWFLPDTPEGQNWQEDHQIALVHNDTDYTMGEFSVGDSTSSLSSGTYNFTPTDSGFVNRDFDQVTSDGNIYCYDTDQGETILVQMTSDDGLRVEAQSLGSCGSGPWSFTNDYTDFIR
ncbi:MAG: hypothetical protein ABH835_03095 [Patescibacteria group bacterium]